MHFFFHISLEFIHNICFIIFTCLLAIRTFSLWSYCQIFFFKIINGLDTRKYKAMTSWVSTATSPAVVHPCKSIKCTHRDLYKWKAFLTFRIRKCSCINYSILLYISNPINNYCYDKEKEWCHVCVLTSVARISALFS